MRRIEKKQPHEYGLNERQERLLTDAFQSFRLYPQGIHVYIELDDDARKLQKEDLLRFMDHEKPMGEKYPFKITGEGRDYFTY
jgi:hypothetical protein